MLAVGLAVVALHVAARAVVASVIVEAPNAPLSVVPTANDPPPELARYGVFETLQIRVGPPDATLAAWVLEPPDARPARATVVVLHGVRLDKSSMLPVARALADAGFRSVLVDLRGHGRSSGDYLTYGIVESRDISQLLDTLETRTNGLGAVGVHGFSYGGATAIHLAARDPRIRAVVAVSAFSSVRGVVRDYLARYAPAIAPAVPGVWLDGAIDLGGRMAAFDPDAAAPARAAERSLAALLVVHGTADEQVKPYHADVLAGRSAGTAERLLLPGKEHASLLSDDAVTKASCAWFERELDRDRVGAKGRRKI